MPISRSAQVTAQRNKNDRQFVRETAIPYGNIAASSGVESLGSSANISSLRSTNSDTTQSRMALPLSDIAKSGTQSLGTTAKPVQSSNTQMSDFDLYNKLSDRSLKDRGAMGNQDIDLTKRKITEVDTLANNEANRALGMQLATQFPYQKYNAESSSAREIMNNAQSAIPTFLNRATAARLNPVSLSL